MPATGSYQQHLSLFKTQTTINRQGCAQGVLLYSKGAFGTVAAAGGGGGLITEDDAADADRKNSLKSFPFLHLARSPVLPGPPPPFSPCPAIHTPKRCIEGGSF